jgi:hypothetical protein
MTNALIKIKIKIYLIKYCLPFASVVQVCFINLVNNCCIFGCYDEVLSVALQRAMSSRSIPKDTFEQDELVLCFEPDPMKARVLYDAKVMYLS